jgi:ATP-dependent helicase/nuclease subunit B
VQALLLEGLAEGRMTRSQPRAAAAPVRPPCPTGAALPVKRLSATAYSDLRACPYRFFALRQLGLQEADELDAEVDKRDFGNWLHAVLQHFHEALLARPTRTQRAQWPAWTAAAKPSRASTAWERATFLPFAAGWPAVRDGYLPGWPARRRPAATSPGRGQGHTPLGAWQLVGTIDRIDRVSSADEPTTLVIDYKTEGRQRHRRSHQGRGAEDTQLAFYAALLPTTRCAPPT